MPHGVAPFEFVEVWVGGRQTDAAQEEKQGEYFFIRLGSGTPELAPAEP